MRRVAARLAVAVFAVGLFAGPVQAQTPEGGWDFGATAGVNFAKVSGDDAPDDAKNLTGFMLGVSLAYALRDMLAFQPELLYTRRGTKGSFEGIPGEVRLDYIDIPLLLRISTGTATQLQPRFYVGPYFGFRVGCEVEAMNITVDCDDVEIADTDYGLIGGVGFAIRNWEVFARFQQGLKSLDDSDESGDVFNRVISVGARVSLRALGGR